MLFGAFAKIKNYRKPIIQLSKLESKTRTKVKTQRRVLRSTSKDETQQKRAK